MSTHALTPAFQRWLPRPSGPIAVPDLAHLTRCLQEAQCLVSSPDRATIQEFALLLLNAYGSRRIEDLIQELCATRLADQIATRQQQRAGRS